MRTEIGLVKKIEPSKVLIEADPDASCTTCEAKHGCMMSSETKKRYIWIETTEQIDVGDKVEFTIEEKAMILSSFLLYILPIIMLFLGIAGSVMLYGKSNEGAMAIGGTIGLLAGFIIIKIISHLIQNKSMFIPRLVKVIYKKK